MSRVVKIAVDRIEDADLWRITLRDEVLNPPLEIVMEAKEIHEVPRLAAELYCAVANIEKKGLQQCTGEVTTSKRENDD